MGTLMYLLVYKIGGEGPKCVLPWFDTTFGSLGDFPWLENEIFTLKTIYAWKA
jgi:hypothetical protein